MNQRKFYFFHLSPSWEDIEVKVSMCILRRVSTTICVIPARGGSKRLPRKNLLKYRGIPLVEIACRTALEAQIFDEVIVSTEDSEIRAVIESVHGAQIHARPSYLATDETRADEVVRSVIEIRGLIDESVVCCLLPTTPKISYLDLQSAYNQFLGVDSLSPLFGVISSAQTPFRSFLVSDEYLLTPLFPDKLLQQSQEYPPCVNDAGQFYFATAKGWLENYSITASPNARGYLLQRLDVVDINTPDDWQLFLSLDQKSTPIDEENMS